jgi:hypothetical protein
MRTTISATMLVIVFCSFSAFAQEKPAAKHTGAVSSVSQAGAAQQRESLEPEFRTWTDATGKFKTEAAFLDLKDGKVRLKKKDGTIVTVALEKLSEADQAVVKGRRAQPEANSHTPKNEDAAKENAWPPPYVDKEIPHDLLKWVGKRGRADLGKQGNYYTFTVTKPGAKPVNMELVVFADPIPVEELTGAFGKPDRIVDDALLGMQFKGVKDKATLEGKAYDYGAVRLLVKDRKVRELQCAFPLSFK